MKEAERFLILSNIDRLWKEHLQALKFVQQAVGLRGYAQRDPLIEYKLEGYNLFLDMMAQKKGVPSAFPHCAGSGEGLSLSPKPYPHKCAEAGARTRDLPVTDGRLYRCTRPALHGHDGSNPEKCYLFSISGTSFTLPKNILSLRMLYFDHFK